MMKILNICLLLLFALGVRAQSESPIAFPGAEGGGKYTTGGRGGKVLYVTNLSDDGKKGSFRWAVTRKGPRTVVFAVSGNIELTRKLSIKYDSLTIAGETAPGDGVCIKGFPVKIDCDNVIVRYLRFRMGDTSGVAADAFEGQFRKNIIIDHCSVSWSTDENASFYGNEDFTMQWCIISESLNNSVHGKGIHGYGAIWGGKNATYHHNLIANNNSRNPRLDHPGIYKEVEDIDKHRGSVEISNNVIYNWHDHTIYGGESGRFNIRNNYYKPGKDSKRKEIVLMVYGEGDKMGRFYLNGNVIVGNDKVSADNLSGTRGEDEGDDVSKAFIAAPHADMTPFALESAQEAYKSVLAHAGASLHRDAVDTRIVKETEDGKATYSGSKSALAGIIDSQTDCGGWPELKSAVAPQDSDNDGMPDAWEKANKLNPDDATDAVMTAPSGYTWIEEYCHSLVR
jgi:hypothetical protein